MNNAIDVFLSQTCAPCQEWYIELRTMGGRFHVRGFNAACYEQAKHYGQSMAAFLGIPFSEKEKQTAA